MSNSQREYIVFELLILGFDELADEIFRLQLEKTEDILQLIVYSLKACSRK